MLVRPLDPAEIDLVAERMRDTLVEVLGAERGATMYERDWLRDRVRFHLDHPDRAVFVVVRADAVVGHGIFRLQEEADLGEVGLVSTTYVLPAHRRIGAAGALLDAGEAFLAGRGARVFATYTSDTNTPLVRLYERRGYRVSLRDPAVRMIRLSRGPGGPN